MLALLPRAEAPPPAPAAAADAPLDELIVCDVSNHRLVCFGVRDDAAEGASWPPHALTPPLVYQRTIGRAGHAPGRFHLPSGVACVEGRRGGVWRLIVSERRRVQVLSRDGVPLQVVAPPACGSQ